jgi:chromosome partitioning protein
MKTLVLANQKGGVGKSAIATQLALYLHRQGNSVLVIDLDHQQNTSHPVRRNGTAVVAPFTATELLEVPALPNAPSARFVLIPGDDRLSTLERQAEQHNAFAGRLRSALHAWCNDFDVCIIDTNPNPDIRYAAALISADFVLAPIQLNQEALEGIVALFGHPRYGLTRISATLNTKLSFLGILPNMVEATPFQRANLQTLAAKYRDRLLSIGGEGGRTFGYIQKRSAIAEAQAAGVFLPDLAKTSARDTWREVRPVFDMILARMELSLVTEASA